MAKITLGTRPKSFKHTVKATLPEGVEGTIEVSYIYRTRTEFGKFIDARLQAARDKDTADAVATAASTDEAPAVPEFSLADVQVSTRDGNAAYIMSIVDGWDVPGQPFSLATVTQLCDELPGFALAIINDYRAAIVEGRLGN